MKRAFLLSLLLALAACNNGEPLPRAEGPWTALNASQWQPTADEAKWIKEQLPERAYADK